MSATTCERESAQSTYGQTKPTQQEVWRLYSRSGPGSVLENDLVEQHLPLVKAVVGRLAMTLPSHISADDLYSAGLVGLLNAVRRFKPNGGSTFESYARVRIRGAVFDELRRLDWVPRSIHEKSRKVEKAMQELTQRLGRAPTDVEMAKAMKLSVEDYEQLVEEVRPATYVCLDSLQNSEGDSQTPYEVIADDSQANPEHVAATNELAGLVAARIQQLPEMQRKVLEIGRAHV